MANNDWYVYILRCNDGTLYTGVTTDCERRLHEHNHTNRGAKYTRARRPVELAYREATESRSTAQQREAQIKRLSPRQKAELVAQGHPAP